MTRGTTSLSRAMLGVIALGVVLTSARTAAAVDHYVDAAATSTTGDGLSWATAWQSFSQVTWPSLSPGDTIWVATGTYAGFTIRGGGSEGHPVTIKVTQEAAHTGPVVITDGISVGADWVTIDGAKSDSYGPFVSGALDDVLATRDDPTRLTDNIGLTLVSTTAMASGINVFGSVAHGFSVRWVKITTSDDPETYGIRMNPSSTNPDSGGIDHFDVGFVWIHDVGQDGVKLVGNTAAVGLDALVIHHTIIEGTGDDGIEAAPGLTVHHSILRDTRFLHGHPDGIAGEASINWRIYDNVLYDWATYSFYPGQLVPSQSNLFFYGNLVYWVDAPYVNEVDGNLSVSANYDITNTEATWTNIVIANNTFVARTGVMAEAPYCASNHDVCGVQNPFSIFNRAGTMGVRVSYSALSVQNNVFYGGTTFAVGLCGPSSMIACTASDAVLDYNCMWSSVPEGKRIGFLDMMWTDADALAAGTSYTHNTSAEPHFVDPSMNDFTPSTTDGTLRDHGTDLSALALPDIDKDLHGNRRGADGTWDIGAIEVPGATLDGGVAQTDASVPADAMIDASPSGDADARGVDAGGSGSKAGGCGCRVQRSTTLELRGLAIVFALGLVVFRRRRRVQSQ